jgi:hypothetical protein
LPKTEYTVSLSINVDAESPQEAVAGFIENILVCGLRRFKYNVVDENDKKGTITGTQRGVICYPLGSREPAIPQPDDEETFAEAMTVDDLYDALDS